jgi:hypothetical protein
MKNINQNNKLVQNVFWEFYYTQHIVSVVQFFDQQREIAQV